MELTATGVSGAPCRGAAFVLQARGQVEERAQHPPGEEARRLAAAIDQAARRLEEQIGRTDGESQEILQAQLAVLLDPDFAAAARQRVEGEGASAAYAAVQAGEQFARQMAAAPTAYLRERAQDMRDVAQLIVDALQGGGGDLSALPGPCVLVAGTLSPSQAAQLSALPVVGLVLEQGGKTSHTAIIARGLGLPCLVEAAGATRDIRTGDTLQLWPEEGRVDINPTPAQQRAFSARMEREEERRRQIGRAARQPGRTRDGERVYVEGNVASAEEVAVAQRTGCEGVGLFRSEFLFFDRPDLPGEEEQYRAYRRALEHMPGHPVTIRTLDAGGDKPVPGLDIPKEDNPFLGERAIRACLRRPQVLQTQLRALLRASPFGRLQIMIPMVTAPEEMARVRQMLRAACAQLKGEGAPVDEHVPLGMMVEVPAAAVCADLLARQADFFSIGTNDLVQYVCAADRLNPRVAEQYQMLHPAVLRLIRDTARAAAGAGIPAAVCGEMAAEPGLAPLLVGLGVTHLSVSPAVAGRVKWELSQVAVTQCQTLAQQALSCKNAQECQEKMKKWKKDADPFV